MAKKIRVLFVREKGKGKGKLVIKDKRGVVLARLPVKGSFDPGTVYLEPHCCDNSLGSCRKRKTGENCADTDKPITVWM